jgi:hypothetical protein
MAKDSRAGHTQRQANEAAMKTNGEVLQKQPVSMDMNEETADKLNATSIGLTLLRSSEINENIDIVIGQTSKEESIYSNKIAAWADYYQGTKPIFKKSVVNAIVAELESAGCRFVGPIETQNHGQVAGVDLLEKRRGQCIALYQINTDEKKIHLRIKRDLNKYSRLQEETKQLQASSVSNPVPPVKQVDIPHCMFGIAATHDDLSSIHEVSVPEHRAHNDPCTSTVTTMETSCRSIAGDNEKAPHPPKVREDGYYHHHRKNHYSLEEPLDICGDEPPVDLMALPQLLHGISGDSWALHGLDFLGDDQHDLELQPAVVTGTLLKPSPAMEVTTLFSSPTISKSTNLTATHKTSATLDQDTKAEVDAAAATMNQKAKVYCKKDSATNLSVTSAKQKPAAPAAPKGVPERDLKQERKRLAAVAAKSTRPVRKVFGTSG